MRKRLSLPLPLLLIVATFALGGCGGGRDTETSASGGDEAQITDVIETVGTSHSKQACTVLATQGFVEQNTAKTGAAAIQDCETLDPGETDADSVKVTNIAVSGDTATAEAAFTGSIIDGQTLTLSLVKEGDQWKVDHADSFANFDRQALVAAFMKSLGGPNADLTPAQLSCIRQVLLTAPPQTIENAILSGQQSQIQALFANC